MFDELYGGDVCMATVCEWYGSTLTFAEKYFADESVYKILTVQEVNCKAGNDSKPNGGFLIYRFKSEKIVLFRQNGFLSSSANPWPVHMLNATVPLQIDKIGLNEIEACAGIKKKLY